MDGKIETFRQLEAWKQGHALVLIIYKHTASFPKEEVFGLTSQIRRAVVSITSNIAEGFSRNSWKEKLQFYAISMGSLTEVENQLFIARDIGYISDDICNQSMELAEHVGRLLTGLIKKCKSMS